jgi:hypothetical protein
LNVLVFYPYLPHAERAWRHRNVAMPLCVLPTAKHERGAAMLEFTIIAMALLFLGLLGPESGALAYHPANRLYGAYGSRARCRHGSYPAKVAANHI